MEAFQITKSLVLECYRVTKAFPQEERYSMVQQLRRAALSAHLNFAEGCSRKSPSERKRFFEISRSSVIEVDTAFDVAMDLKFCNIHQLNELGEDLIKTFKILSGLIGRLESSSHH